MKVQILPTAPMSARVVQLAGDDSFKICTVWVRIPPRAPNHYRLRVALPQKSKIIVGYGQYRNAVASGRT
jgi:hypothetical protein